MQDPMSRFLQPDAAEVPLQPGDPSARNAGIMLVATAVISLLAVIGRVMADAEQATVVESLSAITNSRFSYGFGGAAMLVAGLMLFNACWFLLATWIMRQRRAALLVPWLFGVSGVVTAVSGGCALVLALAVTSATQPGTFVEATDNLRWFAGKLGFTAAGLALLVAARYQWLAGGVLRFASLMSVIVGTSMLLIWWEAPTNLHRFSGVSFLLWLVAMGFMLFSGKVERHFISRFGGAPAGAQTGA